MIHFIFIFCYVSQKINVAGLKKTDFVDLHVIRHYLGTYFRVECALIMPTSHRSN